MSKSPCQYNYNGFVITQILHRTEVLTEVYVSNAMYVTVLYISWHLADLVNECFCITRNIITIAQKIGFVYNIPFCRSGQVH